MNPITRTRRPVPLSSAIVGTSPKKTGELNNWLRVKSADSLGAQWSKKCSCVAAVCVLLLVDTDCCLSGNRPTKICWQPLLASKMEPARVPGSGSWHKPNQRTNYQGIPEVLAYTTFFHSRRFRKQPGQNVQLFFKMKNETMFHGSVDENQHEELVREPRDLPCQVGRQKKEKRTNTKADSSPPINHEKTSPRAHELTTILLMRARNPSPEMLCGPAAHHQKC